MFKDTLLRLSKRLYPSGRAFRMRSGGVSEKVHKALIKSENTAYTSALSVLNSILPDNEDFSVEDARDWERRLGLITNEAVSLADRKAAILRKMQYPGTIKARGHYLNLERELRKANFDVYVHENRFFEGGQWITKTPFEVSGVNPNIVRHGLPLQHGQTQHGAGQYPRIVNSLSSIIDDQFAIGDNLRSTFFIGGENVGDFASINQERFEEFRKLVLTVKPAQTVAVLFINFGPSVLVYDYGDDYGTDYTL